MNDNQFEMLMVALDDIRGKLEILVEAEAEKERWRQDPGNR